MANPHIVRCRFCLNILNGHHFRYDQYDRRICDSCHGPRIERADSLIFGNDGVTTVSVDRKPSNLGLAARHLEHRLNDQQRYHMIALRAIHDLRHLLMTALPDQPTVSLHVADANDVSDHIIEEFIRASGHRYKHWVYNRFVAPRWQHHSEDWTVWVQAG